MIERTSQAVDNEVMMDVNVLSVEWENYSYFTSTKSLPASISPVLI